jgi:hypothetical protein
VQILLWQVPQVRQDQRERLEKKVLLELLGLILQYQAQLALLAHKVYRGFRVLLDLLGVRVFRVVRDPKVQQVVQDHRVFKEVQDLQDLKVYKEYRGLQDHKEPQEYRDQLEAQVVQALQEQLTNGKVHGQPQQFMLYMTQ